MEITVVSEEENPMLHRTDVTFRVSHVEATPDRLAVRDSLAARLNKDADEVVIRKLDTKFGMRTTYGEAKVYQSPAFAKDVEQDYMLERNKIAVGGGEAEEAPAGAEEAPAEAADEEAVDEGDDAEDETGDAGAETADEGDEAEDETGDAAAEAADEGDEAEDETGDEA